VLSARGCGVWPVVTTRPPNRNANNALTIVPWSKTEVGPGRVGFWSHRRLMDDAFIPERRECFGHAAVPRWVVLRPCVADQLAQDVLAQVF
jgi:hypothetical protein